MSANLAVDVAPEAAKTVQGAVVSALGAEFDRHFAALTLAAGKDAPGR